jgi:DNA-binding SARP family transcriptional activator
VAQGRPAEAVRLYGGDLLEDRDDDWLTAERERLAGLHADALRQLARQHEQERRWPEAIGCAEKLVARDPLREEHHRLLIALCQASGDRARAVRAYHVCATTLAGKLGIRHAQPGPVPPPAPGDRAGARTRRQPGRGGDRGPVRAGGCDRPGLPPVRP